MLEEAQEQFFAEGWAVVGDGGWVGGVKLMQQHQLMDGAQCATGSTF